MRVDVQVPVGATVCGVSLNRLSAAQVTELHGLLAAHGFLAFHGQELGDEQFVAFLRRLGRLTFTKGERPVDGQPDLNVVSNVGRSAPPRSSFHVDTSYVTDPPAYTALRAVRLPQRGGHTLFTNQYRAFETLPAPVRTDLEGRVMTHVVTGIAPGVLGPQDEQAAEHPLFRSHPVTGRTALYLTTPPRCAAISGMSEAQTRQTVAFLYEHSTASENVYRHAWRPGDVVVWDNRCVMHRADHSDVSGHRVLHRGTVRAVCTVCADPAQ